MDCNLAFQNLLFSSSSADKKSDGDQVYSYFPSPLLQRAVADLWTESKVVPVQLRQKQTVGVIRVKLGSAPARAQSWGLRVNGQTGLLIKAGARFYRAEGSLSAQTASHTAGKIEKFLFNSQQPASLPACLSVSIVIDEGAGALRALIVERRRWWQSPNRLAGGCSPGPSSSTVKPDPQPQWEVRWAGLLYLRSGGRRHYRRQLTSQDKTVVVGGGGGGGVVARVKMLAELSTCQHQEVTTPLWPL